MITDELREWAEGDALRAGMSLRTARDQALAIADRIDAEHERKISGAAQLLADAEKDRDFNYVNWQDCKQKVLQHNITMDELNAEIERLKEGLAHRIELPKDADGKPIHIGDVMEPKGSGLLFGETSFEVRSMRCDECGWEVYDRLGDRYAPSLLRHYHALTVEDVLCELLDKVDDDRAGQAEIIAEYAAKLRLADDGKEQ